jgi:hypothetical protein
MIFSFKESFFKSNNDGVYKRPALLSQTGGSNAKKTYKNGGKIQNNESLPLLKVRVIFFYFLFGCA